MPRLPALIALPVVLAACVGTPPVSKSSPHGEVSFAGQSWPIEAQPNGNWRVLVGGHVVHCAKPEQQACYWSVRHYLTSQEVLDDLG